MSAMPRISSPFLLVAVLSAALAGGCERQQETAGLERAAAPGDVAGKPFAGKIDDSIRNSEPEFRMDPKASGAAPNIVVILADDLGYSDVSPFGGEMRDTADMGIVPSRDEGARIVNARRRGQGAM